VQENLHTAAVRGLKIGRVGVANVHRTILWKLGLQKRNRVCVYDPWLAKGGVFHLLQHRLGRRISAGPRAAPLLQ